LMSIWLYWKKKNKQQWIFTLSGYYL